LPSPIVAFRTGGRLEQVFALPHALLRAQVKNRAPAAIQITAEQLLLEAQSRIPQKSEAPKQVIASVDELDEFRMRKRKEFEDAIRRCVCVLSNVYMCMQWIGCGRIAQATHAHG
jgi:hypothetical protein